MTKLIIKNSFYQLALLLSLITNSHAELLDENLGYTVNVGVASKQLDLDVYDAGNVDYNGSLTEGSYVGLHLSVNSPYNFFSKNGNLGYYYEYSLGSFKMELQNTTTGEENLGSSASGNYVYFTPVVFYNIGDNIKLKKKDAFLVGMGIGLGYLQASGDIYFTETTNELFDIDVNGFDVSITILMEYQHNDWFVRVQDSGPDISSGNYEYTISDFSLLVGYSIRL